MGKKLRLSNKIRKRKGKDFDEIASDLREGKRTKFSQLDADLPGFPFLKKLGRKRISKKFCGIRAARICHLVSQLTALSLIGLQPRAIFDEKSLCNFLMYK